MYVIVAIAGLAMLSRPFEDFRLGAGRARRHGRVTSVPLGPGVHTRPRCQQLSGGNRAIGCGR